MRFAVQNYAQVVAALESSLVFTLRLGGASGNTYDNGFQNVIDTVIKLRVHRSRATSVCPFVKRPFVAFVTNTSSRASIRLRPGLQQFRCAHPRANSVRIQYLKEKIANADIDLPDQRRALSKRLRKNFPNASPAQFAKHKKEGESGTWINVTTRAGIQYIRAGNSVAAQN